MRPCVLACIDFSPVTDEVARHAALWARTRGLPLVLLHVADPNPDFVGYEAGPQVVRDQVADELRQEHRRLTDLAGALEADQPGSLEVAPLMVRGPYLDTILRSSEEHEAELIVLGSHGHGLAYELFVGSVAQGVIRRSEVPVLVVPARSEGSG